MPGLPGPHDRGRGPQAPDGLRTRAGVGASEMATGVVAEPAVILAPASSLWPAPPMMFAAASSRRAREPLRGPPAPTHPGPSAAALRAFWVPVAAPNGRRTSPAKVGAECMGGLHSDGDRSEFGRRRTTVEPLRPSFEQPSFQSLSRFRQSQERPRKGSVVTAAQPVVRPPVHALRLLGKRYCYVRSASQARPDFPRREYPSFAHRFLLARIGQAQALPARKDIAGVVDRCDPPSTIPSVGIDLTSEPGASATEVAFGPCDWNALPNIFPFGRAVRARTVDEHDSVMLGQNADVARRFIIPGPRPIKG
jgi:hypothetical protein